MMNKQILIIVFICITSVSWGQIHEIGISLGGSNTIGDIGATAYINPTNFAGGIMYKYNASHRVALRGTLSYMDISGDDANSKNSARIARDFKFNNAIIELAIGVEYNFFEYDMTSFDKSYTPYIFLELAAFNYETVDKAITNRIFTLKSATSMAIPFGLGFKTRVAEHIGFSIETRVRYTFVDDLDYTTSKVSSLNFEGNGNDWYVFTGISFVYSFGRPKCFSWLK